MIEIRPFLEKDLFDTFLSEWKDNILLFRKAIETVNMTIKEKWFSVLAVKNKYSRKILSKCEIKTAISH